MRDALAARPLDHASVAGLLLLYALVGAPHLAHLSPLLMAMFYLALAWRALALWRPVMLPGTTLRVLLTLAAAGAVAWSVAGQLDGRALGVGLLTVMAGLKALEFATRRDLYVTVFLGCFMLATQFLFDRSLWLSLYLTPLLLGLLALLAYSNRVQPPGWRRALLDTGKLLVAGLPMALLLFVLFPRLAEPLWALSTPAAGVTGMTDRLDPGSVSQLGQSQRLAFRVTFEGEPPPQAELYWRGPVFWDTDGRSWSAAAPRGGRAELDASGDLWRQEVTLEPSNQHWLFALDRALAAPDDAMLSRDGQLLSRSPLNARRHYRVLSSPGRGETRLAGLERSRALALPDGLATPRMRALVTGWLAADANPAAVVQAALRHFREQPFVYTLYPPSLPGNVVDGFLFDTRRGFCEHYATSFTVLMRLAGVPARVVGGYQGGEWNPVAEHLTVRQSDAHAWAEVWLGDRWQRVDPTAAVAPQRIERPIDVAVAQEGSPVTFQGPTSGWLANLWRDGGWLLEGMELGWQRWVVGYTDRTQAGLLASLGLGWLSGYKLALAAVIAAGLGLLPLWLMLRRQGAGGEDPALRTYRRLQVKLSKAGLSLSSSMTPSAVRDLAIAHFPDQRMAIQRIIALYLTQRYGAQPSARVLRRLAGEVRRLRLPR